MLLGNDILYFHKTRSCGVSIFTRFVSVTDVTIHLLEYHRLNLQLILKTLERVVWKDVYGSFVEFVSNLRKRCPNLRELEVHGRFCVDCHSGSAQTRLIFKNLLSSSLQQLSLKDFALLFPPDFLLYKALPKNKSIHSLRVSNCGDNEQIFAALLKRLNNLRHLYLSPISSSSFLANLGNVQVKNFNSTSPWLRWGVV